MNKDLKFRLNIQHFAYNPKTDSKGVIEGRVALEYIGKILTEALVIPGKTVTQHLMTKSKTKTFRQVSGDEAKVVALFDDSTATGKSSFEDLVATIDNRLVASVEGEFIPNFSDPEFDALRWEDLKDQMVKQMNKYFLDAVAATAPLFDKYPNLTKENIIDAVIDGKTQFKLNAGLAPLTMLASADTIGLVEKTTFFTPNANFTGLNEKVEGRIKSMDVIEHTLLDELDIPFILLHPGFIKLLTINPVKQCAIPGFGDEVHEGLIVRTTKPEKNITTSTTVHMPFGLQALKPKELLKCKKGV